MCARDVIILHFHTIATTETRLD